MTFDPVDYHQLQLSAHDHLANEERLVYFIAALQELDCKVIAIDNVFIFAERQNSMAPEVYIRYAGLGILWHNKNESDPEEAWQFCERFEGTLTNVTGQLPKDRYEELKSLAAQLMAGSSVEGQSKQGILELIKPSAEYGVTQVIVLLNIAVYILMISTGVHFLSPDGEALITWGASYKPLTLSGEWWRLISSCFVHIGLIHLLFNMYALIQIGSTLEPLLGRARLVGVYIITGIFGSLTSVWWNNDVVSAGASGAIFGLFGFYLALLTTSFVDKTKRKELLKSMLMFVGYNILIGISMGFDNAAHIGGLLSGMVVGYTFLPSLRSPVLARKTLLFTSLAALLISISIYLTLPNDYGVYVRKMDEFSALEIEALSIYQNENATDETIDSLVTNTSIPNWIKCAGLLNEIKDLKLPLYIIERNNLMENYVSARIRLDQRVQTNISRKIANDPMLDSLNQEIVDIINRLKAL